MPTRCCHLDVRWQHAAGLQAAGRLTLASWPPLTLPGCWAALLGCGRAAPGDVGQGGPGWEQVQKR